jgi:tryptophan synthase alpha chain
MSRIGEKFARLATAGEKALIPYLTAGDPDLETTAELILEMERAGADIIELGVPFSDPIADGPVIQRAADRALRRGTTLAGCLDVIRHLRGRSEVPLVLFSYLNPLLQFGLDRAARALAHAGADGVLITDLVVEEAQEYVAPFNRQGIDTILLVAPTSTDERMARIVSHSRGFIYVVSRTGVTGTRETVAPTLRPTVERVRQATDLPIAVGFGISTPEHVCDVWQYADAAVVGSAIVREIERQAGNPRLVAEIGAFTRWLKGTSAPSRAGSDRHTVPRQ